MDLSREKIVFKATKRIPGLVLMVPVAGLGMIIMYWMRGFFDLQTSYHSQVDFSIFCIGLMCVVCYLIKVKEAVVQQIYMTETGIIRRHGISGKWCRIDFDRIAAASLYTVTIRRYYRELEVVGLNHQVTTIADDYTIESVDRVAEMLKNNNIPVYRSIKEAKQAAAGYVRKEPEPAEQLNDPLDVYLHYGLTLLPLLIAASLLVGSTLNSHCGTQKDIVTYGTVLSRQIVQKKDSSTGKISSTGEMMLGFGQKKDSFSMSPQFVSRLRIGDRVKMHYTRGCFGLGYGVNFTKL